MLSSLILMAGLSAAQIYGTKPYCVDLGPAVSCEYRALRSCLAASKALTGRPYCVKLESRAEPVEEKQ